MADWVESPSGLLVPARKQRLTAVDLFCGCGGFSLGIIEAGFDVLAGVDNDPTAAETYLVNLGAYPLDLRFVEESDRERMEKHLSRKMRGKNGELCQFTPSGANRVWGYDRPGWHGVPVFWLGDASKLTGQQILDSIGLERGELDLVVGGPPCQGFSMAGRRNVADPRNNMVFEFARLVCEMRPKTMVMENVPGILSMTTPEGESVIDEVCRILERGDYGEFEAMRQVLTGDRRKITRGVSNRDKTPRQKPAAKASKQGNLF